MHEIAQCINGGLFYRVVNTGAHSPHRPVPLEAAQAQLLPLPRLLESLEARVSGALELAELQASLWAQLAEAELLSQGAR